MTQDWKEDSMSHVDEGTLHAYLDGELPSTERAALETHLAQCAICRATLVEERALLERASAVLGSARPVERPAPPLEQLRRSPKRPLWRVRTPLAWAASITLALGLGYYLRSPGDTAVPAAPARSATRVADRVEPAAQEREHRNAAPARPRSGARTRAAPPANALADAAEKAAAPAAGTVAMEPAAEQHNAPASAAPTREPLRLESIVVTGAVRAEPVTTEWPVISRGTARTLLGADPVGLPGLAARKIRRSPAADGIVMVEQALDSSTVIQIFQRSGNAYSRTERDRADRLARFVGRLRVEIAGPLSPDSLNRLLEQVEPLP
jgi:hypothetical protein